MNCDYCKYYVYKTPSWDEPYYEEYCSKTMRDFGPPDPDNKNDDYNCEDFFLSKYGERRLLLQREDKLKRILK